MSDASFDPAALAGLEAVAGKARAVFAGAGYQPVQPPIIQPADIFLDRYGEEIRGRIFVLSDPSGAELCLRPDLTIPTCRAWLEAGGLRGAPARLSYYGPAFRYQPRASGRPSEFRQTGIECFGLPDTEAADAEVMLTAIAACRAAGLAEADYELGDLGLFEALIDTIEVPAQWRPRLKRQFWRPGYFSSLIERLAGADGGAERGAPGGSAEGPAFLTALGTLGEAEARAVIHDILALAEIAPVGGRSIDEIAERFLEQAADASALTISREAVMLIDRFLKIRARPDEALEAIAALVTTAGPAMRAALDRAGRRLDLLVKGGFPLERAVFATAFGRGVEYYTGFVFEIHGPGEAGRALAGGGRYDSLLTELGAPARVPAVGCAIRLERLAAALAGRAS
ncbi:MAG: ATP phosphoribosyltransferase regulatory subunit [Alphaproteobacteria bacterium]|nr:ATP phosphoribosyltransferase regulatory subunit [Alphaproteobacteria bacterium]